MSKLTTKEIAARITELPTLPQVATRLVEIIQDPTSSAEDVTAVMTQDPPLAMKILKLVNSAYFALPNKVTNLNQAVALLGFSMIKGMALSVTIVRIFQGDSSDFMDERLRFWQHSMTVATVSRDLYEKNPGQIDGESAFVLGLLHDIGKIVLDNFANDAWRDIVFNMKTEGMSFREGEQEVLVEGHAHLGAWLTREWRLPDDVSMYIENHHDTEKMYEAGLGQFHLANMLCRRIAEEKDLSEDEDIEQCRVHLGLSTNDLFETIVAVTEELDKTKKFISAMGST